MFAKRNFNRPMEQERLFNANYLKVLAGNFMLYFSFMLLTPLLPLYIADTFTGDKQMIGIVLSGYTVALVIGLGNGHMFPAFQAMFINLAPHNKRGTANSTLLTSWDLGSGAGVLIGGVLAQAINYHAAFWAAWLLNFFGAAFYFAFVRGHFLRNRLR